MINVLHEAGVSRLPFSNRRYHCLQSTCGSLRTWGLAELVLCIQEASQAVSPPLKGPAKDGLRDGKRGMQVTFESSEADRILDVCSLA